MSLRVIRDDGKVTVFLHVDDDPEPVHEETPPQTYRQGGIVFETSVTGDDLYLVREQLDRAQQDPDYVIVSNFRIRCGDIQGRLVMAQGLNSDEIDTLREEVDIAMSDPEHMIISNYYIEWQGHEQQLLHVPDASTDMLDRFREALDERRRRIRESLEAARPMRLMWPFEQTPGVY